MTCQLLALCFDANDPLGLARFWAGVLGWEMADDPHDGIALLPSDDTGFRIRFLSTQEQKAGQNRMHFDLTSTSLEDQQQTVARSLGLGARHIDIGQRPEEGHVVLADPEGNEFCVIEPGNNFLADCGFIGALACDGSQDVGPEARETERVVRIEAEREEVRSHPAPHLRSADSQPQTGHVLLGHEESNARRSGTATQRG